MVTVMKKRHVLNDFFGLWGEYVGQAEGAWSTNVAPSCRKELIGKVLTADKDDLLNWGVSRDIDQSEASEWMPLWYRKKKTMQFTGYMGLSSIIWITVMISWVHFEPFGKSCCRYGHQD